MATLSLSGGEEQFSWRITGLSSAFGQNNGYRLAGITRNQFTVGGVSSITGVVDTISAPATGTSTSTIRRTVTYSPGTYDLWGFTQIQDGTYWPAGSGTVTVESSAAVRPDDWDWYSDIQVGRAIQLSAYEWNAFCNRINDFRAYVGLPEYGAFVRAYSGDAISANICKHAVWAISAMNPSVSVPNTPASGDTITALFFNRLRDALNSID